MLDQDRASAAAIANSGTHHNKGGADPSGQDWDAFRVDSGCKATRPR
ncbi:hypothetical protein ACWDA3_44025 [Nonomuraea rubra]